MSNREKYKIIIIEPSPVIQEGMKIVLEQMPEFKVMEVFSDLRAFQENKQHLLCDIIILNPAIVNFYKQFTIRSLFPEHANTVIVALLYGYVDSETVNSFDGTLDIYDEGSKMIKKLQKIVHNNNLQHDNNNKDNVDLSDREKEILVSIAKGWTNKEIADKHFISVHTVISHRKNITRKTGIKTVSGLTLYAIFNNLATQEDLQ